MGDFQTDLWMREDLYKAFKSYVSTAKQDKTFNKLSKEAQRYVNKTLEDFETQGMKLSADKRNEKEDMSSKRLAPFKGGGKHFYQCWYGIGHTFLGWFKDQIQIKKQI